MFSHDKPSVTPLLDWTPPEPPKYFGDSFNQERDGKRLNAQCQRTFDCVRDGTWKSLKAISAATGDPEASVSARLRDLRRHGFTVERKYVERGLWIYRVTRGTAV